MISGRTFLLSSGKHCPVLSCWLTGGNNFITTMFIVFPVHNCTNSSFINLWKLAWCYCWLTSAEITALFNFSCFVALWHPNHNLDWVFLCSSCGYSSFMSLTSSEMSFPLHQPKYSKSLTPNDRILYNTIFVLAFAFLFYSCLVYHNNCFLWPGSLSALCTVVEIPSN